MNIANILARKGSMAVTGAPGAVDPGSAGAARTPQHRRAHRRAGREPGSASCRSATSCARRLERALFALTVADLMTRDVITGQPHDDLLTVAHTMTERAFAHLPVVDKERLVGNGVDRATS